MFRKLDVFDILQKMYIISWYFDDRKKFKIDDELFLKKVTTEEVPKLNDSEITGVPHLAYTYHKVTRPNCQKDILVI